jgi:hypothetical protein
MFGVKMEGLLKRHASVSGTNSVPSQCTLPNDEDAFEYESTLTESDTPSFEREHLAAWSGAQQQTYYQRRNTLDSNALRFQKAVRRGQVEEVKLMLAYVDPSTNDSNALLVAVINKDHKMVELLVNDGRVNVAANDHAALRAAAEEETILHMVVMAFLATRKGQCSTKS